MEKIKIFAAILISILLIIFINFFEDLFAILMFLVIVPLCTICLANNFFLLYPTINDTGIMFPQHKRVFLIVRKHIMIFNILLVTAILYWSCNTFPLLVSLIVLILITSILRYYFISKLSFDGKVFYCVDFLSTDAIDFAWLINNIGISSETKKACLNTHYMTMHKFYSSTLELDKQDAFFRYLNFLQSKGLTELDIENILLSEQLKFSVNVVNEKENYNKKL